MRSELFLSSRKTPKLSMFVVVLEFPDICWEPPVLHWSLCTSHLPINTPPVVTQLPASSCCNQRLLWLVKFERSVCLGSMHPTFSHAVLNIAIPSASIITFSVIYLCACMQLHGDRLQSPGSTKQRPGSLGQLPGCCQLLACDALQPRVDL